MNWFGLVISLIVMLIGLAGTILPLLPGAPLILLGMVIYGLFNGFQAFSLLFWIGQAVLLLLVFFVDYAAGALGAQRYGGSKAAIWGSIIGSLIGLVTLGPLGIILGPFLGAIAGELIAKQTLKQAVKVGVGTLLGFAGGTLVKLLVEAGMIIWFLLQVF